jgi:hypothetical protein
MSTACLTPALAGKHLQHQRLAESFQAFSTSLPTETVENFDPVLFRNIIKQ